jgi:transcriptional regulator with XRE-family HTH domain
MAERKAGIGERLKAVRAGLSQAAFAAMTGVNATSYGMYERDERSPDFAWLARLKRATGVSLDWLATGEGEMRGTAGGGIDAQLLAQIVEAVEETTPPIDAASKSRLIARLYADRIKTRTEAAEAASSKAGGRGRGS